MDDGARRTLDVYEVACLAGGPDRVVDTALIALFRDGRIRAVSPGELAVVRNERRHPVEAAVLDALGQGQVHSADTVRWRCRSDVRLAQLGAQLREQGLLGRSRWGPVRRRGERPRPSPSGRKVLAEMLRTRSDDDDVWRTALRGRTPGQCSELFDQPVVDRRVRGPRLNARMDELARNRRRYHSGPPQP